MGLFRFRYPQKSPRGRQQRATPQREYSLRRPKLPARHAQIGNASALIFETTDRTFALKGSDGKTARYTSIFSSAMYMKVDSEEDIARLLKEWFLAPRGPIDTEQAEKNSAFPRGEETASIQEAEPFGLLPSSPPALDRMPPPVTPRLNPPGDDGEAALDGHSSWPEEEFVRDALRGAASPRNLCREPSSPSSPRPHNDTLRTAEENLPPRRRGSVYFSPHGPLPPTLNSCTQQPPLPRDTLANGFDQYTFTPVEPPSSRQTMAAKEPLNGSPLTKRKRQASKPGATKRNPVAKKRGATRRKPVGTRAPTTRRETTAKKPVTKKKPGERGGGLLPSDLRSKVNLAIQEILEANTDIIVLPSFVQSELLKDLDLANAFAEQNRVIDVTLRDTIKSQITIFKQSEKKKALERAGARHVDPRLCMSST